jgi:hypothetical protein
MEVRWIWKQIMHKLWYSDGVSYFIYNNIKYAAEFFGGDETLKNCHF